MFNSNKLGTEKETQLDDCESGNTDRDTIIANPGSVASSSSFERDMPCSSTVSRGAEDIERGYKVCLRIQIVGLSAVIVIVWTLLLLPVIFYHLPDVRKPKFTVINSSLQCHVILQCSE